MVAAQNSQFYMSKYASKYYSSINNSKFNVSRVGFENKSIMGQIKEEDETVGVAQKYDKGIWKHLI